MAYTAIPGSEINTAQKPRTVSYRYLFLLATVIGGSFVIFFTDNANTEEIFIRKEPAVPAWYSQHFNVSTHERFAIMTDGCNIPAMKPWDDSVKGFVSYPTGMPKCNHGNQSLLSSNTTHIWVNQTNIKYYNITNQKELLCCYKHLYRQNAVDNVYSSSIDDRIIYEACINFTDHIKVKDEFVTCKCKFKGKQVYEQFYAFTPKKNIILYDGGREMLRNKSSYNVLILGIDNVSRLNFHRTMPKTLAYLKKKGVVELLGYNKVGSNSYPNIVPMLVGTEAYTELPQTCYPHNHATFDFCPFIWNGFKKAGFYTALGEDASRLGTFNYLADGFFRTPTDYYLHPFIHQAESIVGGNKDWSCYLCMGDKYFFQVLLDYVESLTTTLKLHRLFSFFWTVSMTHDYVQYPMVMDNSYVKFFERLEASKYLDESIIFLVSDHGIRWGSVRHTKQGHYEERLPFVFILTPKSFQKKYSEAFNNLRSNSRRLTSPYDIHETLVDLIDIKNIKDKKIIEKTQEPYAAKRGISLFLPIPRNRTCKIAGIDDQWCTCFKSKNMSLSSKEAVAAAGHLIEELNSIVREHPECAKLSIEQLMEAAEMEATTQGKNEKGTKEYMVVVKTTPGGGLFEATVRNSSYSNWTLAGPASRLNLYGDQSRCVHNPQLKLYCYCK